jgi:hypothetical protein
MLNLKRFAIFSLTGFDLATAIDEKSSYRLQHTVSRLKALGYAFKVVKGSYKGVLETSILVICDDDTKLDWVRNTAFQDGQESILVVNEDRRATLEYNPIGSDYNPEVKAIGNFRSITAIQATELDAWTLDGVDYYACI